MKNRFFTIMIVPERTSEVRRWVIPAWIVRSGVLGGIFAALLGGIMVFDYWYVMGQIDENKNLKIENRRLRQQTQIFRNRIATIESTMDRVENFSTRLRVITNIEERDNLVKNLNMTLPDAATNVGFQPEQSVESVTDPETIRLQQDQVDLENQFSELNHKTLLLEQDLQDLYELLVDQKVFLAALPTRKPAVGYFTSGFGVRRSPFGTRDKMHEGLDIANHPGTPIVSTAHGMISFAGRKPGYGKTIIVDHGYGLETWYAHSQTILVKEGQKVHRGQQIALMGTSGRSTGSHVHYEVRVNGIPVDPLSYILEN